MINVIVGMVLLVVSFAVALLKINGDEKVKSSLSILFILTFFMGTTLSIWGFKIISMRDLAKEITIANVPAKGEKIFVKNVRMRITYREGKLYDAEIIKD